MKPTIIFKDNDSNGTISLSKKELNLIIETLLFSSSVNIGAEWVSEDYDTMVELAQKFENSIEKSDLKNITFFVEENYNDNWTVKILNTFKGKIKEIELSKA
jgi:hypothetical protein